MTTADASPLRGPALRLTAAALALGTFMQVLDSAIANVSLPTIAGNLGNSTDDATWVVTAFAAANGVTVPLTGEKRSLTAFTLSTDPKLLPPVTVSPTLGSSTETISPSVLCA